MSAFAEPNPSHESEPAPVRPAAPVYYAPAQADPRAKSPALASFLSIFPGLGQVYVGYYPHGFVNALVVASLVALLSTGDLAGLTPLAGMFLAFFWFYNIIDAGRRAALYNQALAGKAQIAPPSELRMPGFRGSIAGGLVLIAAGAVLLSHTRWGVSLDWVDEWWPVAPMLLGVWLVVRAVSERK